jgi:kynureninase
MTIDTELLNDTRFRDRFLIADESIAYLDGNSLGRLPKRTQTLLSEAISQQWGHSLIGSWNSHWLDLPTRIGDKIGQLIGAGPGNTIVTDSTSINIYKLASALLQLRGDCRQILTDRTNFPTDIYILEGLCNSLPGNLELTLIDIAADNQSELCAQLDSAITDNTALVVLSHVHYQSGLALDIFSITEIAHRKGARILWDLSHSVGAMPIDLAAAEADAAVGCTYKYLNGGPGAPAFLYCRPNLRSSLSNPIQGWFGAARPFDFTSEFQAHDSISKFTVGTPPVLSLAAIEAGVDLTLEAGISYLRNRSIALSSYFVEHALQNLTALGYRVYSPQDPQLRGSHVSLWHEHAWPITQSLIRDYQVIPDFRAPSLIRFGFTPLYTTTSEIDQALQALRETLLTGAYRKYPLTRSGVT